MISPGEFIHGGTTSANCAMVMTFKGCALILHITPQSQGGEGVKGRSGRFRAKYYGIVGLHLTCGSYYGSTRVHKSSWQVCW